MTIPEEVDKQKLAIQEDIDELVAAARKYLKQPNNSDDNDAKLDLTLKASRLVQTVRGPHSMPWTHFENVSNSPKTWFGSLTSGSYPFLELTLKHKRSSKYQPYEH